MSRWQRITNPQLARKNSTTMRSINRSGMGFSFKREDCISTGVKEMEKKGANPSRLYQEPSVLPMAKGVASRFLDTFLTIGLVPKP